MIDSIFGSRSGLLLGVFREDQRAVAAGRDQPQRTELDVQLDNLELLRAGRRVSSMWQAIEAVKNGEADAVFADKDALSAFVTEDGPMVWSGEDVPLGDGIGIGMRKSDSALKEKLNAAITKLKESGELNTMIKKWFGDEAKTF